jgi:hypothetical protein
MNTARGAGPCGLNLRRRPSNVLQCLFAQDIGIAFSGSCKFDDLRSDGSFDAVVAVSDPQSDANHFEGNAEDAPILRVEPVAIDEWGDRHGRFDSSVAEGLWKEACRRCKTV